MVVVLRIAVVLLVYLISTDARAATYNFHFNNTEQGENSKASPTLTVGKGPGSTSLGDQAESEQTIKLPSDTVATDEIAARAAAPKKKKPYLDRIIDAESNSERLKIITGM